MPGRRSNLLLERADSEYAPRATSNAGHFVPTAPPGQSLDDYLVQSLKKDEPLNAVRVVRGVSPGRAALTPLRYATEASC